MKKVFYAFVIFLNIFLLVGCGNNNNSNNEPNYEVNRASTSIKNTEVNDETNPTTNAIPNDNNNQFSSENNSQGSNENNQMSNGNNNPGSNENNQIPNGNNSPGLNKNNQNPNENNNPGSNENNQMSNENQPALPYDNSNAQPPQTPTETTVSEFSTKILTKSKNRANNIKLTCDKINDTIVKAGQDFSFCNTIGVSKESDGYKKADVIVNKKIIQALGGGNCQVSSTLFNAVLQVSNLNVTERHPHGKKVNYVPEGKDAAIAHGSKDFKFKNNSGKDLKIYASSDGTYVNIKLVFLE